MVKGRIAEHGGSRLPQASLLLPDSPVLLGASAPEGRNHSSVNVSFFSFHSVFAYTPLGGVAGEAQTLFGGTTRTVSYDYDQYGHRTSTTYPDGSTAITRTNTWDGRIDTLGRGGSALVAYDYLGSRTAGRAYSTIPPAGAAYSYDHLGRLTDIEAGGLVDFHYTYEPLESNIDRKYFHHRGPTVYNGYDYDDLDRVTRADYLVNELTNVYEAFGMDDLGNRAAVTLRDGTTDAYAVNPLNNQYDSIDSVSLTYDDAGNLTTDKDGYLYAYDYENRIVEIRKSAGTLVATMDYDTQGRRVRVYDAVADATTLYYYSDTWQVLSEYDPSGSQQAYYVYGNYIDEALLMHRSGADRFYLHDHLYSPAALLDATGAVIERYEYDAYGKAHILTSGFSPLAASQYGNRILYTGRENDRLDNGNLTLQNNRNRYLSHFMGCWYSPDPIGYVDGLNLYEYAQSEPLNRLDAYGLEWHVLRNRMPRAYVAGNCGDTVKDLAFKIRLDERKFRAWLRPLDSKPLPKSAEDPLKGLRLFSVPNTVIVGISEINPFAHMLLIGTASEAYEILDGKGFNTIFYDSLISEWSSDNITRWHDDLYGIVGFGHGQGGAGGKFDLIWTNPFKGYWRIRKDPEDLLAPHFYNGQFGLLVLKICYAKQAIPSWEETVSKNGVMWLGNGSEAAGANWGILDTVRSAR